MRPRNTYARTHRGAWADDADSAIAVAFAEVGIDPEEWGVMLTYSDDSFKLDPHDPAMSNIIGEVTFSETRQQYKAVLRKS